MEKYIDIIKNFFDRLSNSDILNPSKKTITVAFCIIIAVICAVSGVFVIGEITDNKSSTAPQNNPESISSLTNTNNENPLETNLLFALEGSDKLELLGIMRLSSGNTSVKISFISSDAHCVFNNLSGTMNEHYKNGGTPSLVQAAGEFAEISIDRYIIADYASFKSMLNKIGDMDVFLEHDVICGQDAASLIIEKGAQTLVPEMMTKYFGYLCENLDIYGEEIAKTMMSYGEKLFCTDDENDIEKNFSLVLSTFKTDISAQDFVKYKPAIKALANKEVLSAVTVEKISAK